MRQLVAGLLLTAWLVADAAGQSIVGTYTSATGQGGAAATLVLQQDAQGRVTGTLSGNGVSYAVSGEMRGQDVAGLLTGGVLRSYFEARLIGTQLRMVMADIGADGKPMLAGARTILFALRDAAPTAGSTASSGAATRAGAPAGAASDNPLVAPGSEDKWIGTFAGTDVTLTLKREGAGYTGTIRYGGEQYPAMARKIGRALIGAFQANGASYVLTIAASGDGRTVSVTTGGATYLLTRTTGEEASAVMAGGAAPAAGGGANPGASDQDRQLVSLLTSSAWCSFTYSGSSTYAGTSSGTTQTSRAVFRPDGLFTQSSNRESTFSGSAGSAVGNNSNGQRARWKVERGQLLLSENGIQWVVQPLQITQNSNGYPIVTSEGKEYTMCR